MQKTIKRYFEVRPFSDALRYLFSYSAASYLARGIRNRPQRFFNQGVGSIDRHIITQGHFEKGALEILRLLVTTTGYTKQMLDIGGNIGNHAVALADLFDRVDTFEPHPVLFKVLEANAALNGKANVIAHNFGLGNENAEVTLIESNVEHGLSKVRGRSKLQDETFDFDPTKNRKTYEVRIHNAEEVLGKMPSLAKTFIKIDVEGMEQEILYSILPLITAHRPIVSFEWFSKSQPDLMDFAEGLHEYDFYGILCDDVGQSKLMRSLKLLISGRSYSFQPIVRNDLAEVYTLAVLVPKEASKDLLAAMNH